MRLIRGPAGLRRPSPGCVLTIGTYDGLHLGHQALLARLIERAAAASQPAVVVTFEPMPREYLQPKDPPARLTIAARALAHPAGLAARLPVRAALR